MKGFGDIAIGTGCLVAFLLTLLILHASKANALGQTEEGILYGIGIYKIFDIITEEEPWEPGQTSSGYGDQFPPFRCKGSGIDCAYQRGVYEREKEEWEDAREKAYECGRYGRNCDQ
jgi:hypothetical protein